MVYLKEILESTYRNLRKIFNGSVRTPVVNELTENGISIQESFLTKKQCENLCAKIDKLIADENVNVWKDGHGADHRIYFVNLIDSEMNDFFQHPAIRKTLLDYTGTKNPEGMLLAAKIEFKNGNVGSGGGWHRDSPVTHQFKAICYLNDVDEQNGPFEYIKGSHTKSQVMKSYLGRIFRTGQYRFSDSEINSYLKYFDVETSKVLGKAGTLVLADTKGIHRGHPLASGFRYVLFCYFWDNEIPAHFEKLKQVNIK